MLLEELGELYDIKSKARNAGRWVWRARQSRVMEERTLRDKTILKICDSNGMRKLFQVIGAPSPTKGFLTHHSYPHPYSRQDWLIEEVGSQWTVFGRRQEQVWVLGIPLAAVWRTAPRMARLKAGTSGIPAWNNEAWSWAVKEGKRGGNGQDISRR